MRLQYSEQWILEPSGEFANLSIIRAQITRLFQELTDFCE